MILFHKTFENYYKANNYLEKLLLLDNCQYSKKQNQINLNQIKNNKLIVLLNSRLNISSAKSSNKVLSNYVNNKFISRNFWQKLFNQYWQETIFVSISNPASENYINKLKSNGLLINRTHDYKNFLANFSKALINGQIQVDLNNQDHSYTQKNSYLKYIWKKGINCYLSRAYNQYLSIKNKKVHQVNINISNIEKTLLPIFTIANNYNQIVMAECADQIFLNKNILQFIYQRYHNLILKNNNKKPLYTGLFFTNPEDAYEYKEHILSKYKISSRDNYIKCFIGQLNLYTRLLQSQTNQSDFRLIPDLKELSDLIYFYQYYKNIKFDKKQLYGRNYFQGQPIYIIEPVIAKNINTNKKSTINYTYNWNRNNQKIEYKAAFLNYKTAIIAWNKFKQKHSYYRLPNKPSLSVSNLEKFLKENNYDQKNKKFIFVPSMKTYHFIKQIKEQNKINQQNNGIYFLINKNIYLQGLFKRVIWSLTSRQPINW